MAIGSPRGDLYLRLVARSEAKAMSIDLKKNGSSLKAAYEDVLNKSSDTDW